MRKAEKQEVLHRLADLAELHAWMGEELKHIEALLTGDATAAPVASRPAPAITTNQEPPRRNMPRGVKRSRSKNDVEGGSHGAVAESMRRAMLTEASDFLKERPDLAFSTGDLVAHVPTARVRYKTYAKQVAGLSHLLASMGPRFNIKNVSTHTKCRWMYVTPIHANT